MDSQSKSSRKKRSSLLNDGLRQRKRVCLEDFFTEIEQPETIFHKFLNQIKKLEEEEITLAKLKSMNNTIRNLKKHNLQEKVTVIEITNLIKRVKYFLKDDFINDFQLHGEGDDTNIKSDVEIIFESCLMCFSLIKNRKHLDSEINDYLNDILFFWKKVFDNINFQLSKVKKLNISKLKQLLADNIRDINDLIQICNFSVLNHSGLIKSFICTVLHHTDYDIQMAALTGLRLFHKKGGEFRALIINLTFNSLSAIDENHKFKKNYKIHNNLSVSMFTILILDFVENVPIFGFHSPQVPDESTIQNSHNLLQESLENVMKVVCFIITTFIKKIGTSTVYKVYRNCFSHLVFELIEICNEPDWPSARMVLNVLLKLLADLLGPQTSTDIPLKIFAVKTLHAIIKKKISDKNKFQKILDSLNCGFEHRGEHEISEYNQKLLINYLSKRTGINVNSKFIHGIQWYENIKFEVNFEEKASDLIKIVTEGTTVEHFIDPELDEDEEMRAIVYYLDTVRRSHADYQVILKYLLLCCNDKAKKIKSLAIQCLLELILLDNNLLSQGMMLKIVLENLSSFQLMGKRMCDLITEHLRNNPEKCEECAPFLLRLLDTPSEYGKKIYLEIISEIVKIHSDPELKTNLVHKVLGLSQDENSVIKQKAVDLCTELWLDQQQENLDILLEIVNVPNAGKHLRIFLEGKLNLDAPADSYKSVIDQLLKKIGKNEKTLECLQILSIIAAICPEALISHLFLIASPLTRPEYSRDYSVEILCAEIMNYLFPTVADREVRNFASLKKDLAQKLSSLESLNYSMGFIVSLLKLLYNLCKYDLTFLFENCFQPNLMILQEYNQTGKPDNKIINKALCTVIYLHVQFPDESEKLNFPFLLDYFIQHPEFCLTTIHSVCYLSIDYKQIMKNESLARTITKYLKDRRYPLPVTAVLYNILCSLKNISKGQLVRKTGGENESLDPVKNVVQTHIKDILDCTIDERIQIREIAYSVVKQLLFSGLISESRLIPSILLMSTDPVESIANIGVEIMAQIPLNKLFEFTRNSSKCIIASFVFNCKCSTKSLIRGYKTRNQKTEASCNHFYALHQEDVPMRRQIIDSILTALNPEAQTNAEEKLYLADNLMSFTYKYQEEVYYVLCQIEMLLVSVRIPEVPENDQENKNFINKYYGVFVLTYVKSSLMGYYNFSTEKLRKYYQEDDKKDLVQTRKFLLIDVPESSLPKDKNMKQLANTISETLKICDNTS